MFKCKTCGRRFPESKGTVFYNRHLTEEQIILICKLLVEKNGIRAIERIMEIHIRLSRLLLASRKYQQLLLLRKSELICQDFPVKLIYLHGLE
jgi:transposase-like protein